MADDNFKSLLSPNKSWYDVARGAFGGVKKQQRSRRAVMGLLFGLDLWESNKRAKIEKNLQELEDQKVLEHAKLAKQFDKSLELIKTNDAINAANNKQYGYYDSVAEDWFKENISSGSGKYYTEGDEYGLEFEQAKERAKKEYIDNVLYKEHQDKMKGVAVLKDEEGKDIDFIRTKEAYFKPYDDYYKAQKKEYMRPENVSAIHQMLGIIPGFGTDASKLAEATKNAKAEYQTRAGRREVLFSNPRQGYKGVYDTINALAKEERNFEVDTESAIQTYSALGLDADLRDNFLRDVKSKHPENKLTLQNLNTTLETYALDRDAIQLAAVEEDFNKRFVAVHGTKENPREGLTPDSWTRLYNREKIKSYGFDESSSEKMMYLAEEYTDLIMSLDPDIKPEKRGEMINDFVVNKVGKEFEDPSMETINAIANIVRQNQAADVLQDVGALKAGDADSPAYNGVLRKMENPSPMDIDYLSKRRININDYAVGEGYNFSSILTSSDYDNPIFRYFANEYQREMFGGIVAGTSMLTNSADYNFKQDPFAEYKEDTIFAD
tara:strand:- start:5089 stop:6741 length:1653 start_codon:yes stop_codon:yes gene_type:complete